jgi:succinoglycan biosynthesis transport protein ExoP
MPDDYEIEEASPPEFASYLDIARRRHMQFLVPMLIGFVCVWGASWLLKPLYKSTTVILVEQPSMPKNYVLPNVGEDMQEQLSSISEQIMSRSRLLSIIGQYHLFASKQEARLTADEKVASMSKAIDVQLVHGDNGGNITSFSISFTAGTPRLAQAITRELANTVITQNLEIRQKESENTTNFLDQQLQLASQNLAVQEAKVKAFDAAHEGTLPSQQQSNLQILAGLQQQFQSEQDALNNAIQQRAYYQTLIEQYRTLRGPVTGADGNLVDVATMDATLAKERAQLADLRSRYTESYPDVQALEAQIARTEKERNQALTSATSRSKEKAGDPAETMVDPTQNAPLVQLQGQLHANQLEIANREKAITALRARIGDYQARLGAEPASEEELADLTRGYEASQANYNELLKKRDDSQMATNMEQMQRGERFSVLEPATLPWKPDFPNRLKFCAMGLAAGILLGFVSVFAFQANDDRMYGDKEIKALLPVPVISEIPQIVTPEDERQSRRKNFLGWVTGLVVLSMIVAGAAISVLHP